MFKQTESLKPFRAHLFKHDRRAMFLTGASLLVATVGYFYLRQRKKCQKKVLSTSNCVAPESDFFDSALPLSEDQLQTLDLQTGTAMY